jgi:hypothetical protein
MKANCCYQEIRFYNTSGGCQWCVLHLAQDLYLSALCSSCITTHKILGILILSKGYLVSTRQWRVA